MNKKLILLQIRMQKRTKAQMEKGKSGNPHVQPNGSVKYGLTLDELKTLHEAKQLFKGSIWQ
jgi:hypothetical protein